MDSIYIGLTCQHCGRPIMTKMDIDHISDVVRRGRVGEVKKLLTNLKCRECDKSVADQVIWSYLEFMANEYHDWVIKNCEEVWPYENKIRPYKFAVHKSGNYGTIFNDSEKGEGHE